MQLTPGRARELGRIVAVARARSGMSTRVLAARIHTSQAWVTKLEAGRYLDPSTGRLARLVEALDIEPSRIDLLTRGALSDSLPGMRTYFRAKYALTPRELDQVVRYVKGLRKRP